MKKKKFRIMSRWSEYGELTVEANNLDEALEIAERNPERFTAFSSNQWDDGDWHIVPELSKEIKPVRKLRKK